MNYIEIIGIFATVFILISMSINTETWKGDVSMRIINIVGSIVFTVYGFLLPAYSTGILNALLVVVNSYHLIKLIIHRKDLQAKDAISREQIDKIESKDDKVAK